MRVLLKVEFPVGKANAAMKAGTMPKTIQAILAEQKPEAVYFTDSNGKRCGMLFFDLKEASQIPFYAEPWMQAFDASIELHPVMVPEDLAKASSDIEQAVKKYG